MRLPDVFHPLLPARLQSQPGSEHFGLVEVAAGPIHREPVVKLNHGDPLLRLQEVDLHHVAIEAEEVEELLAVELVSI